MNCVHFTVCYVITETMGYLLVKYFQPKFSKHSTFFVLWDLYLHSFLFFLFLFVLFQKKKGEESVEEEEKDKEKKKI